MCSLLRIWKLHGGALVSSSKAHLDPAVASFTVSVFRFRNAVSINVRSSWSFIGKLYASRACSASLASLTFTVCIVCPLLVPRCLPRLSSQRSTWGLMSFFRSRRGSILIRENPFSRLDSQGRGAWAISISRISGAWGFSGSNFVLSSSTSTVSRRGSRKFASRTIREDPGGRRSRRPVLSSFLNKPGSTFSSEAVGETAGALTAWGESR
mmetsp:Transcript_27809/g.54524  ORF Transcript_27809/g.54524 Transcript_27809/m.54524 type:complete len:210 (-) Transcript_27809:631-1260(-)